ncbi:MAG: hypothetical protein F6J93_03785 [Oscillatoria sp. SIO1A7]|nr:hypothetical protein [Oscillatoria sp. SIO1A7]
MGRWGPGELSIWGLGDWGTGGPGNWGTGGPGDLGIWDWGTWVLGDWEREKARPFKGMFFRFGISLLGIVYRPGA